MICITYIFIYISIYKYIQISWRFLICFDAHSLKAVILPRAMVGPSRDLRGGSWARQSGVISTKYRGLFEACICLAQSGGIYLSIIRL